MPILYKRKRQLILEKKRQLVPSLQQHISLRNVSAALKLPVGAQETLARALDQGIQKQRLALEFLLREPYASIERLIEVLEGRDEDGAQTGPVIPKDNQRKGANDESRASLNAGTALTDLLMDYGLYENRLIAETVASSDYLTGVRELVFALERVREPWGAETETVTLALCAVAVRLIKNINELLDVKKTHRDAVLHAEALAWSRFIQKP